MNNISAVDSNTASVFQANPSQNYSMQDSKSRVASLGIFQDLLTSVKDSLYHKVHVFIGRKVIVAQDKNFYSRYVATGKAALEAAGGKVVNFKTADGLKLEGMHFVGKECTSQSPTVILFNGVGLRYELYDCDRGGKLFNVSPLLAAGCNVLLFNYRGVGNSEGSATRDGLVVDGEAALQFIKYHYKVPLNQIILHGHSLGAAVSVEVAASFPQVNYCNDRSFISLADQVKQRMGEGIVGEIAARVFVSFGWEFDPERHWDKIQGHKWVMYLPEDLVIAKGRFIDLFKSTTNKPPVIVMEAGIGKLSESHIRGVKGAEELAAYLGQIKLCV